MISVATIHNAEDFAGMRKAGQLAAETLDMIAEYVKPGVTTESLDKRCFEFADKNNACIAPLFYKGFPKSVCTSVNEVICHGIPDSRPLQEGDIVNIDVTVYHEGVHGDTSVTFPIGEVSERDINLIKDKNSILGIYLAKV